MVLLRSGCGSGYGTAPPSATSSEPTVLSTLHSRQRKNERKITKEELQVFTETLPDLATALHSPERTNPVLCEKWVVPASDTTHSSACPRVRVLSMNHALPPVC